MADVTVRDWGIYVYYAADVPSPAMRRAAKLSLLKLADVGSNDHVGITAMLDVADEDSQFYVLPPQPADQDEWIIHPKLSVSNLNSASTDSIQHFFQWSLENCPARQIALVFYGHGYAIDDYDPRLEADATPASVPARHSDDEMGDELLSEPSGDPTAEELSADHFARSRNLPLKFIFDSTYDQALNNYQVADVIRACRRSLPADCDLSILGLDCCSMAMAEVLCEMEGCAKVAVAAQTGLPFQSWMSQRTLQKLLQNPSRDPLNFAKEAVKEFIKIFEDQTSTYVALSASNLELCQGLEGAARALASALIEIVDDEQSRAAIFKSCHDTVCFDEDGFIDFDCFCGFLSEDLAANDKVVAACAAVRGALKDFVIASEFAPNLPDRKIALATGLSIWFPPWIEDPEVQFDQKAQSIEYFQNGYRQTKFALATGWDKFLSALLTATQGDGNREAEMTVSSQWGGQAGAGKPSGALGKLPDPRGREESVGGTGAPAGQSGGQGVLTTCCTGREAGVVIRASVESFGPPGDAELTVNVKWPAASLAAVPAPCRVDTKETQPSAPTKPAKATQTANSASLVARRAPALQTSTDKTKAQDQTAPSPVTPIVAAPAEETSPITHQE